MVRHPRYSVGVDIGKAQDHTAVVLLEHDAQPRPTYLTRGLYRFPLGTPFGDLASRISARINDEQLRNRTQIAIDATGVGAPIVELFEKLLPRRSLYAITITGGIDVTGSHQNPHIPKADLIAAAVVVLEQRRLRIASSLREAPTLAEELIAYRRRTSESGHDTYGAAGNGHDDLVLALSLALWIGENRPPPQAARISVPRGRMAH
jgi:Terminase RNaseH-like domain